MIAYLLTGLSYGSLYALLGLGLVLTFRSTNVLNFAQGGMSMLMAFIAFEFATQAGLPILAAIAASLVVAGVLGGALYNILIYPPAQPRSGFARFRRAQPRALHHRSGGAHLGRRVARLPQALR